MLSGIYAECYIKVLYAHCHYAECRYAKCHYAEGRGTLVWAFFEDFNLTFFNLEACLTTTMESPKQSF
jgi:hypothetical protein